MFRQLCFACFLVLSAASATAGNGTTGAPGIQAPSYKQSDSRLNADRVRHPKHTLDLSDDMSDPELLIAAMMMGANPEIWLKAMERAGAANVPRNLVQAISPDMLTDWFFSSIEPQFQQTVREGAIDDCCGQVHPFRIVIVAEAVIRLGVGHRQFIGLRAEQGADSK